MIFRLFHYTFIKILQRSFTIVKVVVKARGSNTRKLSYVRNGSVKALTRAYKVKNSKFSSPKLDNRVFIKPVEE